MEDRMELGYAVGKIATGYFFIYFHFNIETLDILPNWLGYILIMSALYVIGRKEKEANLIISFAGLMVAYEALLWALNIFGVGITGGILSLVDAAMGIVTMYFHFQLLTNLATISKIYDCSPTDTILKLRTVNTVLLTLFALPFYNEKYTIILTVLALIAMFVLVWIWLVLRKLKRELLEGGYETL